MHLGYLASDDGGGPAGGRPGHDYEGGDVADYTPPGAVSMVNQATIDYFNQTYHATFANPKAYYDWVFGGNGSIIPSSDPAQDTSLYYLPEHGNATSPVNQPLSYDPPDTMTFKIVKAALIAASLYAGGLAAADMFGASGAAVTGAGADPLSFTAFDAGATQAGAADLAAAAQEGATVVASGVDPMSFTAFDAGATPEGALDLQAAAQEGAQKLASEAIQQSITQSAPAPDVSLPAGATPAEAAAHSINTAGIAEDAGSIVSAATKIFPMITGVASAGTALYRALNPLSPGAQNLTAAQQQELQRRALLTQQQQQAQNKNLLLIGAIAAGVFLLARPDKRTKGKSNATRPK